jgi:hypothetical protein
MNFETDSQGRSPGQPTGINQVLESWITNIDAKPPLDFGEIGSRHSTDGLPGSS